MKKIKLSDLQIITILELISALIKAHDFESTTNPARISVESGLGMI